MTKGGALPKGFERPSDSRSQEKYEETKPSPKTITLRISKFNPEKDHAPSLARPETIKSPVRPK